jgi:riboflavin synthase
VFTGLIQDVGRVEGAVRRGDTVEIDVAPHREALDPADVVLGESIAVEGVCLTVTERSARGFRVLAGPETLTRSTLRDVRPAMEVNLERALRASDRLGGHIVSGHVDGVGELAVRRTRGPVLELEFRAPREVLRYVVEKGSIAVDGISLTVNRVDEYSFAVALIPHTIAKTTLAAKAVGARINLEVDVVGKYIEKLVKERYAR